MRGGGGSKTSRRTVAGTLAAKVTTEGVAKLTREFNGLWDVLKKVRGELNQINTLSSGGGGMGGVGRGTSTGAAGSQTSAAGRGDAGMLDFSGLARGGGGLMNRIVNRYTGAPSSAATTTRPGGGYSVGNLPVGAPSAGQLPLPGMEPGPPNPPDPRVQGGGGAPPGGGGGWGGQNTNVRGPGGFQFFSRLDTGVAVADVGLDVLERRFGRNVAQSAPISARDAFTAAMYGPQSYRTMEMDRYKAGGDYAGTRENVQSAQQIALGLGQTGGIPGTSAFIAAAGRTAQASGGALTIDQAAAKSALFASPGVSNRARALGIMQYKTAGKLNDPKEIALGYIKNFEKLNRSPMNEFDYANARSPGAPIRKRMMQLYDLDDEGVDMVLDFGMENMQFRTKTGRDINFANPQDIEQIVPRKALGPTMARYATTGQRREASFFHEQEGAESGRLEQEINLQEALQKTEKAFSDLLTPIHEFGRYLKIATSILGGVATYGMLRSLTGGGGGGGFGGGGGQGILSQLLRRGGPGGAATAEGAAVEGAAAVEGTAAAGGTMASTAAAGAARFGGGAILTAGGAYVSGKGLEMAGKASNVGDIFESALTTAGGFAATGAGLATLAGPLAPVTVPVAAAISGGVGLVVGTYKAASSYFAGREARNKQKGYDKAIGMTDEDLIKQLKNYKHNASPGGRRYGQGAGPEERGAWDAWAARRGALLAAALDAGEHANSFGELSSTDGAELKRLVAFFSSEGVFDDNQFHANIVKARKYTAKLVGTAPWREYFGDVGDPAAYKPVTTDQANKLVQSGKQVYEQGQGEGQAQGETPGGAPAGDAVFAKNDDVLLGAMGAQARRARGPVPRDPFPKGGDPVSDRAEGMGETWNKLDSRMKDRLLKMFRASGGRVWLGGGWRSEQQQKDMFLSRYTPDPNGSIEWQGQKWRHVSGPAAAPPGRSMHEIGMAADLDGDTAWAGQHGAEFGLKDFSDVNNEDWHFQLAEFPNSRTEFEKNGGTTDSSAGGAASATTPAPPQPFSSGGGSSISGIGYSIAAAAAAVSPPGAVSRPAAGTAAAGAATGGPGWTGAWPSEEMERGAATAKVAAAAGFTGQDLVNMVAISFRESGWHTDTWVTDNDDVGGGLWAINQLPWLSKGLTPPWTKEEIQNPTRAAQIAKELFDQRGYQPWTTAGGAMARTDQAHAQAAVAAAHLGDAVFDPGMTMPMPMSAGKANVTINVQITSTGNVNYDAKALGDAVRPALTNVMAEISTKRGS